MNIAAAIFGVALIAVILWDAFEVIILPRRVQRRVRLARLYYRFTWSSLSAVARRVRSAKRRERYLGFFGPLSLLLLIGVWGVGLIFGFALLNWGVGTRLSLPPMDRGIATFATYLYLSGVTFFTVGYGEVTPAATSGRVLAVTEAGTGLAFLAIVIGYLPVLYQAFSRREVNISLLDARAGSPSTATELLRRHALCGSVDELRNLLHEWERWSAELLESHISYPVLSYFRSQHDNQSWLGALTAILDTCALVATGDGAGAAWQAQLTFAIARHAVVDLSQVFGTEPRAPETDRLTDGELAEIRKILARVGFNLREDHEANETLAELRGKYEPYVNALSELLLMSLPPWFPAGRRRDNWQTSRWEHEPGTTAGLPTFNKPASKDEHAF